MTIPFKVCGFDGCAVKRHLVVTGNLLNYQLDIFRYNKNIFLNLDAHLNNRENFKDAFAFFDNLLLSK